MAQSTQYAVAWRLHGDGVSSDAIAKSPGVHRATVFRWFRYIRDYGIRGLERWRRSCMHRTRRRQIDPRTKALLVQKRRHEPWCGQKLQWWLRVKHGICVSVATIYRLLHDVFTFRWAGKRNQVRGPVPRATKPREVLQMDTVHSGDCFTLSVVDTFTRECLMLPLRDLQAKSVARHLPTLMDRFGRPIQILQTDNGSEFQGTFQARVRRWATTHRRIHPGAKEENGFVESLNRTLRKYGVGYRTWRAREFHDFADTLRDFTTYYNERMPHLSLGLQTPTQFAASCRI